MIEDEFQNNKTQGARNNTNIINVEKEDTNIESTKSKTIDIDSIVVNSIMNNKIIIFALLPLFVGYYLQDAIFTRSIAEVTSNIPAFIEDVSINKILIVILPYIIAMILFYVSNVISSKTSSKIEVEILSDLTNELIESIRSSKTTINVNDLMIHIKKLAETKNIYNIIVTYVIPTIIVSIGLIYNFTQTDSKCTIAVIIVIIMMILVTTKLEIDSINNAYKTEESTNDLYDEIHEVMANIDTVITSNTKEFEMKNVKKFGTKTYELGCISDLNNTNTTYGLQALSVVAMLGINYMSYNMYMQNKITIPVFTSTVLMTLLFIDYYNYCIHAIGDLITSIGRYSETKTYFENFKFDPISESDKNRTTELIIKTGDISLKNIVVKYENKYIFNDFSLDIKGQSIIGLIGPIGSGKTTILKLLAGIVDYSDGVILIDNQDLKTCTYQSIVRHIAYISQHPKLFNKSIYYNINYGSSFTEEQIDKKLNELGLREFIDSFPKKLATVVGKEGSKISGGQRQFIALIRAIVQNKSIFLLDEPSSSLDDKNKHLFMHLIGKLKNKTIIISTHDQEIMKLFNKVINLNKSGKTDTKTDQNQYKQKGYEIEIY
jgi:ABC-type bacteriocin/lantibiotic exporter with double-glycine peptidase domain